MRVSKTPTWSGLLQSQIITVGSLFSLAGLAALIIFTIIGHWQLSLRLEKTEEVRQALLHTERITAAFSEARSYGQLFEVTRQDRYQQEATDALNRLKGDLSALSRLSEGEDLEWLKTKVEALQSVVKGYKPGKLEEAINSKPASTEKIPTPDFIHTAGTIAFTPSLPTSIDQIRTLLTDTLTDNQAAIYRSKWQVWCLSLGTGILALGIIVYAFRLVWQEKQERLQTEQNLMELNINKDKFFSIISHDLRGPAANIVKLSEFIQEDGLSAADYQMMANHLHKSAQNLHKLLENLLNWARLQMGRVDCKPETINLHQLAEESISQISSIAAVKNITLQNEVPASALAFADEKMCDTVLRNLLLNAIKFTHAQGTVRIHTAESNQGVELRVSDTGVGMTPEAIGRLFKLGGHFTSKGTANEPGSGLGLILCKELVEKNKGQIGVASEPNKGSTFMVTLPKTVA